MSHLYCCAFGTKNEKVRQAIGISNSLFYKGDIVGPEVNTRVHKTAQ